MKAYFMTFNMFSICYNKSMSDILFGLIYLSILSFLLLSAIHSALCNNCHNLKYETMSYVFMDKPTVKSCNHAEGGGTFPV